MASIVLTVPDHITLTMGGTESGLTSLLHNPTFVGVLVTAVLGLFGVWVANVITGNLKDQELFLKACEFLDSDSGTKSRALGIGVLKNYAEKGIRKSERREAVAIIFQAQIFHLIKGGHTTAPYKDKVEAFNYLVMKKTLAAWGQLVPAIVKAAATDVGE